MKKLMLFTALFLLGYSSYSQTPCWGDIASRIEFQDVKCVKIDDSRAVYVGTVLRWLLPERGLIGQAFDHECFSWSYYNGEPQGLPEMTITDIRVDSVFVETDWLVNDSVSYDAFYTATNIDTIFAYLQNPEAVESDQEYVFEKSFFTIPNTFAPAEWVTFFPMNANWVELKSFKKGMQVDSVYVQGPIWNVDNLQILMPFVYEHESAYIRVRASYGSNADGMVHPCEVFANGMLTFAPFILRLVDEEVTSSSSFPVKTDKVEFYPNPASDYVVIKGRDVKQVQVYNLWGELQQVRSQGEHLDVSGFLPGLYIIVIDNMVTGRFFKN